MRLPLTHVMWVVPRFLKNKQSTPIPFPDMPCLLDLLPGGECAGSQVPTSGGESMHIDATHISSQWHPQDRRQHLTGMSPYARGCVLFTLANSSNNILMKLQPSFAKHCHAPVFQPPGNKRHRISSFMCKFECSICQGNHDPMP